MKKFISHSYDETVEFAKKFAKELKKGTIIAFVGGLGMGKTAFVTGLVAGLGIDASVSSPTFAIVNEYNGKQDKLYHFDMYRVENWDDLYSTGYFDYVDNKSFVAIEWSENIFGALPDEAVIIEIEKLSENERKFVICKKGDYKC